MEQQYIRVREFAKIMGVSNRAIYYGIKKGKIPAVQFGLLKLIPKSYLEKIQKIV